MLYSRIETISGKLDCLTHLEQLDLRNNRLSYYTVK